MNELKIFENKEFGKLRVHEIDGEFYFIGKEVTEMLGYRNGSRDIQRHCDCYDVKSIKVFDGKQVRNVIGINESGLYSLILGSQMSNAKEFKRWVTKDVLPSIRKNSAYITPNKIEDILNNPDTIIQLAINLKNEQEKRRELEEEARKNKDKILLAESIETNKNSIYIKDLAMLLYKNDIKIGQNRLFELLRKGGYLCESRKFWNKPTQTSLELGIMEVKEHSVKRSTGYESITFVPMVTGKGQAYFIKKFLEEKYKN